MGYYGYSGHFQAMDNALADRTIQQAGAQGKGHQDDGRGQGECGPGGSTPAAATLQANGKAYLTAGRPGQELAQGDQVGIVLFGQPAAPGDKFVPEITQVRCRAAKGGQAQGQEGQEDFANSSCCRAGGHGCS